MADEWRRAGRRGRSRRPSSLRDLADLRDRPCREPDRADAIAKLLAYGETDTLCYRADPDEPLYRRQRELWEPLLAAFEARHGRALERVSGVVHRPQPAATLERLRAVLEQQDDFTLAALSTLAPLAASLTVALTALEPDADTAALFAAANCEQDWQAELWGWERAPRQRARGGGFAAVSRTAARVCARAGPRAWP